MPEIYNDPPSAEEMMDALEKIGAVELTRDRKKVRIIDQAAYDEWVAEEQAKRVVPQDVNAEGYNVVLLDGDDGPELWRVDALALKAWVGECPPGHEVEHINGDLRDDDVDNLRYVPAGSTR